MEDLTNLNSLVELARTGGEAVLVFVIWLITVRHFKDERSESKKQFGDMLASQKTILDEMSKREQQNFQLLRQLIESNDYVAGAISALSTKIDNNLFCPLMRKDKP